MTLLITSQLSAQVWNQVGGGLDIPSGAFIKSTVDTADNVYVAFANASRDIEVWKWNGLSWSQYPDINLPAPVSSRGYRPNALEVFNGELFVAFEEEEYKGNVAVFKNGAWVNLFLNRTTGVVADLLSHNGSLYLGGNFVDSNNAQLAVFAEYNGVQLFTKPWPVNTGPQDSISDLVVYDDTIYAHGHMDSAYIQSFQGTFWKKEVIGANVPSGSIITSFRSGTQWFGVEQSSRFFELGGDSAIFLGFIPGYSSSGYVPKEFALHEGNLFISQGKNQFNNADPLIKIDTSGTILAVATAPAHLGGVASAGNELFVFATDSAFNVQLHPSYSNRAYVTGTDLARISGKVYLDVNANCTFDFGDQPIPFSLLGLNQGGSVLNFSSNANGNYAATIFAGTYGVLTPTMLPQQYQHFSSSCNLPSSISLSANQNFQQDVALEHDGTVDALVNAESYAGVALYGFTQPYKVVIQNPGIAVSGLVTAELTIPSTMTLVSSVPQSTSVSGNKHTFTLNGLDMFEEQTIQLRLKTNTSGNALGDTLCLFTKLNGINGDVYPQNNFDTLCLEVRGAFDPNDKTPSAKQILPGTNQIDYRIRFQNTGTAPAVKVTVVDTLDLTLPITAIIMNSASHPYSISVQNNILIWEFDNIMLPDSGTDQMGSQGYISFSAGLNPSLGLGDSILNDAEIYFDYQKPVHTNKARTLIVDNISQRETPLNSLLELYPNPTRERLFVKWKGQEAEQIQLLDVNGRILNTFLVKHDVPFELDVQHLPPGVYFVKSAGSTTRLIVQ